MASKDKVKEPVEEGQGLGVAAPEAAEAVVPEVPAAEAPVKPEKEKKDKSKKVESDNGFLGVSPQGAAIFAPGKHPKERQMADKAALEEAGK